MNSDFFSSTTHGALRWFQRRALVFKVFGVALLGLILLIPLGMVRSTLAERSARHLEAVRSVTATWGGPQRVAGPVLVVPYRYTSEARERQVIDGRPLEVKVEREQQGEAVFLPERLAVGGELHPSVRRRGIYKTPVYTTKLTLSGHFSEPSLDALGLRNVAPQWEHARVCFAISDLRGAQEDLRLRWGAETVALQPGARFAGLTDGVHAPVRLTGADAREFAVELTLNGSEALRFLPLGKQTEISLRSSWPSPSFGGAYLPVEREVRPDGFVARWRVGYYGRGFPQQWSDRGGDQPAVQTMEESGFGVSLIDPVNAYRTVERAIKHGALFIALIFATFFVCEVACGVRLGTLNYLLVGAALCLFYLGLLALSELVTFTTAYVWAAGFSTLMIALYARRILCGTRRACLVGGLLGGVYGYLFFVLRMEDFSLLAGTVALFAMLAAVMYATRTLEAPRSDVGGRANDVA